MPMKDGSWRIPSVGQKVPWMWRISSGLAVRLVGICSKLWLEWLNTVQAHNKEVLQDLLDKRPKDQGLLTVSNHKSCIDDPMIWGFLKMNQLLNSDLMRWTSAAEDICFKKPLHAIFFSMGKVFPLVRGDGVYQRGTDFSIEQLNLGKWVHFFPEGKINLTQESMRLKWGVGRIIADCKKTPLVIPIWHVGMDSILPNSKPYIPQIRKQVTVLIGEPMDFTKDVETLKSKKSPEVRLFLTNKIQEEMQALKIAAESLHKNITSS
uniref:Tafazzin family protein n=1 Tax=Arion vulgaris TaxID=1028688 RepID=A0A0B6ZMR1_9EUPU